MDALERNEIMRKHYLESPYQKALGNEEGQFIDNPSCGDQVRLLRQSSESGVKWFFDGQGCSISQVSASILCQVLDGKGKQESIEVVSAVLKIFKESDRGADLTLFGDLMVLEEVLDKPVRKKCVLLAWKAAQKLLEK